MGAGGGEHAKPFDPRYPNLHVGPLRRGPYRELMDGDVIRIFPAVYDAPGNGIYIGPNWNSPQHLHRSIFSHDVPYVPKRITVQGVTVDGRRPVIRIAGAEEDERGFSVLFIEGFRDPTNGKYYFIEDLVIENIDIDGSRGIPGRAAIYINGCKNCTLRDMRITNYRGSHGILAGPDSAGTLLVERIQFDGVGGGNGPDHPLYSNASRTDPEYTLHARGIWARNGAIGHLLKSRSQQTIVEACYFEGRKAADGEIAESYLVDISEGGLATIRNNVFVDNYSGNGSNGAALTFGPELRSETAKLRTHRLIVTGNLFITFSSSWNSWGAYNYPLFLGGQLLARGCECIK